MLNEYSATPGSFRRGYRCADAQGTMERGHLALVEGWKPSFPGRMLSGMWLVFLVQWFAVHYARFEEMQPNRQGDSHQKAKDQFAAVMAVKLYFRKQVA